MKEDVSPRTPAVPTQPRSAQSVLSLVVSAPSISSRFFTTRNVSVNSTLHLFKHVPQMAVSCCFLSVAFSLTWS